jgi:hypothetical protein
MKKVSLLLISVFLLSLSSVAQESGLGIGIMLGEPSGLSLKKWLSSSNAIDAGLGWSFSENGSIHLHADYLYHNNDLIHISDYKIPFYFGIGGRLKFKGDDKSSKGNTLGIRVPVGLVYQSSRYPVDVFFEIVPILDVSPDARMSFNSAVGVRYYLK